MIYSLTGKLLEIAQGEVVIECAGVGYLVAMPTTAMGELPATGQTATVYTHLSVSENGVALYGFASKAQRQMFLMLTGVSGVGPKVALGILAALQPDAIVLAVSGGNHKAFTAASGVGPKLAARIVLELKDKVAKGIAQNDLSYGDIAQVSPIAESAQAKAVAALVSLGYHHGDAAAAVSAQDPTLPLAEIIRLALRGMGSNR